MLYLKDAKKETIKEYLKNQTMKKLNNNLFTEQQHLIDLKSKIIDKRIINQYEN